MVFDSCRLKYLSGCLLSMVSWCGCCEARQRPWNRLCIGTWSQLVSFIWVLMGLALCRAGDNSGFDETKDLRQGHTRQALWGPIAGRVLCNRKPVHSLALFWSYCPRDPSMSFLWWWTSPFPIQGDPHQTCLRLVKTKKQVQFFKQSGFWNFSHKITNNVILLLNTLCPLWLDFCFSRSICGEIQ